ncbi:hypothetical protein O3P69_019928 [Scylla paramamosain]|uniref:Uncharacterized protein n=1 Tax=Scylla paramamosain TaxID=85552 RepID=A0AAW0SJ53_SCYPA
MKCTLLAHRSQPCPPPPGPPQCTWARLVPRTTFESRRGGSFAASLPHPGHCAPVNCKVEVIDEVANYRCDPGYTLFGSSTIQCKNGKWNGKLPVCATNIAYRKPSRLSSTARGSSPSKANDGHVTFLHEGERCALTAAGGASPWWLVDLLQPYTVVVVRVATSACCDTPPLQNLEIRIGNSTEIEKNRLCGWEPGSVEQGVERDFSCAIPLRGRYISLQTVGVENALALCEVQAFSTEEFAKERCSPTASLTTVGVFNKTCYEFRVDDGVSFDAARERCQQSSPANSSDLAHGMGEVTHSYLTSELATRAADLKADLVWVGVRKDPEFVSRTWRWVDGTVVDTPRWGRAQPNNYNGKQNCVALDKGRKWLWNDVGCELDYLPYVCQYAPMTCGSPDKRENTTLSTTDTNTGSTVTYTCPTDSLLVGNSTRTCLKSGLWSGSAPTCKYVDCGQPVEVENGVFTYKGEERNTYNSVVTYKCNLNYTLKGESERVCGREGVWTPLDPPTCLYSWCPPLTPPPHGRVISRGQRSGDTAEYTCEEGYLLTGAKTVSCQLGGAWSDEAAECKFIDCGLPPDLPNGRITLLNHTTHLGSLAKYSCDPNHWLDGPEQRQCGVDAAWSQEEPACVLVTCAKPTLPADGYVTGYSFDVGAEVIYHCNEGYRLETGQDGSPQPSSGHERTRSMKRTCQISGLWSGNVPSCVYTDCGHVPAPPEG